MDPFDPCDPFDPFESGCSPERAGGDGSRWTRWIRLNPVASDNCRCKTIGCESPAGARLGPDKERPLQPFGAPLGGLCTLPPRQRVEMVPTGLQRA